MSMEIRDEAMGRAAAANNNSSSSVNSECSHPVVKGKRTKRQRVHQSPATAASSTSSSSGDLSGTATEEDEDMANCLILLAQGRTELLGAGPKSEATALQKDGSDDGGGERFTSRRLAEAATTNGKPGFYIYECKTCNKCFRSFQALGGHRSSHKKPKMAPTETATEEKAAAVEEDNPQVSVSVSNPTILSGNNTTTIGAAATAVLTSSTNNNNNGSNNSNINNKNNSGVSNLNKSRVHECSICGSEFSSGQALGGHMRRHRPAAAVDITKEAKKEKSVLSLDLNLPAPADDDRGDYPKSPSFPFPGGQPLLFSPSALVDCHY